MLEKLDGMFYQYHVKLVKFLLLEMYESLVFAFILPLAMLFSVIFEVNWLLFHACETSTKLVSVSLRAALSKFSSCCFEGNTSG